MQHKALKFKHALLLNEVSCRAASWLNDKFWESFYVLFWPDQLMTIDDGKSNWSMDINQWQLVSCYWSLSANLWPIDNHKLEFSNCYRLLLFSRITFNAISTMDNSWKNISREWKYSTNWWTFNKGAKYPLHQWEHFYCSHGLCFVKNYSFEFGSVMKIRKVLLLLFTREMAAKHLLRLIPGF